MASYDTKELSNGSTRHLVRFREGGRGGTQRTVPFADKTTAMRFKALVEAHRNQMPDDESLTLAGFSDLVKTADPRTTSGVTITDYALAFIDTLECGRQQRKSYEAQVRDHITPYFDNASAPAQLAEIMRGHMRNWQRHMTEDKELSGSTVQNIRGLLIPMFAAACRPGEWGEPAVITSSPMDGLKAPEYIAPRTPFLRSAEDAAIFFTAAYDTDPDFADLLYVICAVAARWGEAIALMDDAVFLGGRPRIEVRRKAVRITGEGWKIVPGAKTANGWRELPVDERAGRILADRCASGRGLLFPGTDGGLITYTGNYWRDRWQPVLRHARALGLGYNITIKGLRKTTLTMLAESGVDPTTLKAFAGHASAVTTLNVYSDATGRGRDKVMTSIAQFMPAPVTGVA